MAVYTVANTIKIGKPCRVFDGVGEEIEKCVYCDDETGEVQRHARNEKGNPVVDFSRGEIVIVKETRPLPFRMEWI